MDIYNDIYICKHSSISQLCWMAHVAPGFRFSPGVCVLSLSLNGGCVLSLILTGCVHLLSPAGGREPGLRGADRGGGQVHRRGDQRPGQVCVGSSEGTGGAGKGQPGVSSHARVHTLLCAHGIVRSRDADDVTARTTALRTQRLCCTLLCRCPAAWDMMQQFCLFPGSHSLGIIPHIPPMDPSERLRLAYVIYCC